ncbi:MAG TPA: hypothetical protein VI504_05515, partial [Candidatus Eisenbacteria bacterium]
RRAVRAAPARWGWTSAGRISAFADEDPFTEHGALLHYLDAQRASDPLAARLAAAIEAQGTTLDAFGGAAHVRGVERVEANRGPAIVPEAAAAGRALLAAGVEVVVVSNSGTEKLRRWFAHAGVPASLHPERIPGALRLRGAARKFVLAPGAPDPLEVGSLRVDVARPDYARVLSEEAPDAVVGDVFSLDLALPLAMKRRDPAWRAVRLFWLVHPYTPERMRRELAGPGAGEGTPEVEAVEGGLAAAAKLLLATR